MQQQKKQPFSYLWALPPLWRGFLPVLLAYTLALHVPDPELASPMNRWAPSGLFVSELVPGAHFGSGWGLFTPSAAPSLWGTTSTPVFLDPIPCFPSGSSSSSTVSRDKNGRVLEQSSQRPKQFLAFQGEVSSNFYKDALKQGADPKVLEETIKAFRGRINFRRDFRSGDRFELLYMTSCDKKQNMPSGIPLFASFTVGKRVHTLYAFQDKGRSASFYTTEGEVAQEDFLRKPVDGARLSSGFGLRRHPILGGVRKHNGADWAAPYGTPVRAAGDGVVEKVCRYGSYGKYILIRHPSCGYKTAYAHLSRYEPKLRVGQSVKKGSVIAYVGSTGRARGPHLHFEVRKNGVPIDPVHVTKLPRASLTGKNLKRFKAHVKEVQSRFQKALAENLRGPQRL